MTIEPIEHGLILNQPAEGYVRSPGLHMSDIYGALYKGINPKRYDKPGPPDALAMEYGSAFEEELEESIARNYARRCTGGGDRPGEYAALRSGKIVPVGTTHSVIFSPDHFFYNGVTRLGEFKSTRMTIASGLSDEKFDKWRTQIKSYAKPLKMLHARLIALFINGHGKWQDFEIPGVPNFKRPDRLWPSGPLMLAWDMTFTQKELDDEWEMLMRFAVKKGMDI